MPAGSINGTFYAMRVFLGALKLGCVVYIVRLTPRRHCHHRATTQAQQPWGHRLRRFRERLDPLVNAARNRMNGGGRRYGLARTSQEVDTFGQYPNEVNICG